ncbi:hypothetical protein ABIA24_001821 [Sinorhizobium fredii]|uniref:hypothetical protein n=1 Tax=Rhizobium fredii TaxID=380 RepID=UPI0035123A9F
MKKPHNSIGRCIYCDGTDGLTREHVIPEGLGGRLVPNGRHEAFVLRDASCHNCTSITRAIEGQCQGKMMGHFRAKHGFSRKDRKREMLKVKFTSSHGEVNYRDIEPTQLPAVMLVPIFGEPGLLSGASIGGPYSIRLFAHAEKPRTPIGNQEDRFTAAGIGPDVFGQMLAKIALGFAVSQLGIDGFKPLVRGFILGERREFGHWIGGPMNDPPEPPSSSLHEMQLASIKTAAAEYVAVYVRLFANLGCPRNYVIVGQSH